MSAEENVLEVELAALLKHVESYEAEHEQILETLRIKRSRYILRQCHLFITLITAVRACIGAKMWGSACSYACNDDDDFCSFFYQHFLLLGSRRLFRRSLRILLGY